MSFAWRWAHMGGVSSISMLLNHTKLICPRAHSTIYIYIYIYNEHIHMIAYIIRRSDLYTYFVYVTPAEVPLKMKKLLKRYRTCSNWCDVVYVSSTAECPRFGHQSKSSYTMTHALSNYSQHLIHLTSQPDKALNRCVAGLIVLWKWLIFHINFIFFAIGYIIHVTHTHIYIYIYIQRERERENSAMKVISIFFLKKTLPFFFKLFHVCQLTWATGNLCIITGLAWLS